MSMGKQLDEKRQREPPPTSEGCIDAPTGTLPLEGGAEYMLDEGGLAMEEPESQRVLRSLQEAARHGQRASYKSLDPELVNKLDQNYHLLLFASPPPWIIRHPFLSFTPSMAIRSPPTPPSIAHRSSLPSPTMFILPDTLSPRHHLRINNEKTSMSDGGDQEAAQILVSLRSATNVSTNLHSTPTPDPLTLHDGKCNRFLAGAPVRTVRPYASCNNERTASFGDRAAIRGWDFLTEEAPLRSPEEERELAQELANMQFGPEELSREEVMPSILAPIPLHPASSVTRLEASVNPGDTVGTNSSASFAFPFNSLTPGGKSPTQTVVSELLDEYGQLHSVGEQDPAQIVFQRSHVFRDDAQILARTTSSDTERSSIWGEPSPEAIESLAAVRRMEDEYRRVADEFLAPPPEQPAPDNVLGLVFEEAPAPPIPAEPPSTAIVYTAWPQGLIVSPSDIGRITNTVKFEFGTATSTHHAALDCPPTPVVHRQPAVSFTAIARGPELWDRPPVAYADNNPCYPHFLSKCPSPTGGVHGAGLLPFWAINLQAS
ncbi:hypothetical protein C8F01DRAFT_1083328 [Mycena amicta]|nr:hypothetical protein C8F01DRAFT_1083328 [Mycena amicta]